MKIFFRNIKVDYQVFRLVHPGNAILNFFYLPSFRIVLIFRLSQLCNHYLLTKPIGYFLTILNDFFHGVWIGSGVKVGKGFYLGHPRGLVVNPHTIIGEYCSIIQQVTIGGPCIVLGDYVSINAGAKIISDPIKREVVEIRDNCIIAAGAVVLKSMPESSIIAGMPAKVVKSTNGKNWFNKRQEINKQK